MKKLFILLLTILLPMVASADAVEINGIYYNLITKGKIAEVTYNPNKYEGEMIIPESVTYDGIDYCVTSIGDRAFYYCQDLKSICIPKTIISIGNSAFGYCEHLHKVIAYDIEAWCKIEFKSSTSNPLYYDGHLYCDVSTEIKDLVIPNSITTINDYAFFGCVGIYSVTIEGDVTSIGKGAFYFCNGLTSINIPNSVTAIGEEAFLGCTSLGSINIPNGISEIKDQTFRGCSSLNSILLPSSLISIGNGAFSLCSGLSSIDIPNNVTSIEIGAFGECTGLLSITIPNNVIIVDKRAFAGCINLGSVTIGNSVTKIGDYAFSGCNNLTSLIIGKKVTSIGTAAFANCKEINDVYSYPDIVPTVGNDIFSGSYIEYATLHVPEASIDAYGAAEPWKDFKSIVKIAMPKHKLIYVVDDEVYKSYEIEEGEIITPEPAPTKEGFTFSGWSEIPETMPANDVTITGTFTINKYKLIYQVDGVEYKTFEVEYGASITPEAEPTKEGYTFSGWSDIPETMPAHDVTVTGTFTINKYKLTYIVDGVEYKSFEIEYNSTITPEADPTKEGYTFSGWSEIPETMPAKEVYVVGTFTINKYKITYVIDGEVYLTEEVEYGSMITPPNPGDREGYDFAWEDYPETMPAHDITINGAYTPTGIEAILASEPDLKIFTVSGKPLNKLQKGVNILRYKDRRTRKIVAK